MTPDPATFGPELEGLLREIAADPQSQLLRQRRPTTVAGLLERSGPVRSVRTGLTAAERHLVEVHRDELADVLRRACLMRFYSDPERSIFLNRSLDAHTQIPFDSPEQWRARARDALADARRCPAPLEGFDLLEACLCAAPDQRITITQLARASLLLQPTDVAEDYVGLDQVLNGQHTSGERILKQLIANKPSRLVASCAFEALGLSAGLYRDDHEAMMLYKQASLVDPGRVNPLMSWTYFAARVANTAEFAAAVSRLDAIDGVDEEVLSGFVHSHQAQDQRGAERADAQAQAFSSRTKQSVSYRARRILDAV